MKNFYLEHVEFLSMLTNDGNGFFAPYNPTETLRRVYAKTS